MSPILALLLLGGQLLAQTSGPYTDYLAAGIRALDRGAPAEAAAKFARALDFRLRAGAPADELLDLRVTLASASLEAGEVRQAESVLRDAQQAAPDNGISRAELLNASSALHLRLGQLPAAEAELQEAQRILRELPDAGKRWEDLSPSVLHNLAAIEMRTGRYAAALDDEQDALRCWQKKLSSDHPMLIRAWASLSSIQYMLGHAAEAHASMQPTIASAEKAYGTAHPLIADLLESDAIVLEKLKRKKEARQARERARTIRGGAALTDASLTWNVREIGAADRVNLRSR
jgi:tetratricopeptide (TPR) repeat protein